MPETAVMTKETEVKISDPMLEKIRAYWNEHIHDLELAKHPLGTHGFFKDLDEYRFDKLRYLPNIVDFNGFNGKKLLEVGCGVGIDLVRFARGGANVVGVDLADKSIELAQQYFKHEELPGSLCLGDGQNLKYENDSFDVVYAHGVIQYTADAERMVAELKRVVRPGGQVIIMVYNRNSWLNFMSERFGVALEHEDAPVLKKYTIDELKNLLSIFAKVEIVPERFPVKSRLQKGLKAAFFNNIFVPVFNIFPKTLTRSTGWHLMAFASK